MEKNSVRLIDDLGRIVLPHEVRQAMAWVEKTPVEIWLSVAEEEVVIKRHQVTCVFCGQTEKLKTFHKESVCQTCQKEISKL